jgi:hypothetical protein
MLLFDLPLLSFFLEVVPLEDLAEPLAVPV